MLGIASTRDGESNIAREVKEYDAVSTAVHGWIGVVRCLVSRLRLSVDSIEGRFFVVN